MSLFRARRSSLLWALPLVLGACGGVDEAPPPEESTAGVAAAACSATKLAELMAPATTAAPSVLLNCAAVLTGPSATITKKVIIQGLSGRGARLDCRGGSIAPTQAGGGAYALAIRSQKVGTAWQRPEDVEVRSCTIRGAVRVYGMGTNGEAAEVRASSRQAGHTARAQAAAPTDIRLDRLHIIASGTIPLYLSPGTTRVSFTRSEISGTGSSVAIYLDAESGHHLIRDNNIHLDSESREQIAVDGSAHNRIYSNRFAGLDTGGIYLYRNCGEGGTVRHQSPVENQIIGNVFYYNRYSGSNPAVWLASRNGWRTYCWDDNGFPWGSSVDNRDFARHNVVADNLVYVRSVGDMIVDDDDGPNYFFRNRTVSSGDPVTPGCFVTLDGGRPVYVGHGETFVERTAVADTTTGTRYTCQDAALTAELSLPLVRQAFECSRSGSNDGCSVTTTCPAGRQLAGLRAACDLETGTLAASAVSATAWDRVRVARRSDVASDGACVVSGVSVAQGEASLGGVLGAARSVVASCRERDSNGGDCAVRGELLCL